MNQNAKRGIGKQVIFSILAFFCLVFQTWASELTPDKENEMYYRNFENLFDSDGAYKTPGSEIVVGDHLAGIINVQNINVEGTTPWFQTATDQITGIFAMRVEAIESPDNYDPSGTQIFQHIVFGLPTVNIFCKGSDCFSTAVLQPGEMIAFFRDRNDPGTSFEYNGDMSDDVQKATDGILWLTLGYSAGTDATYGTNDDDGYFYSHQSLSDPIANFTGEAWAGLNAIRNNTGYFFGGINDPNEVEIGDILIPWLFNDIYLSSELEPNPSSVNMDQDPTTPGHQPGISPWDIRSNDPAHMLPIEEEGECRMTGGGVTEDGKILLPEFNNKGIPIEGTVAEASNNTDPVLDRYQFGGQVGAPSASYGNWTHHQQRGPMGMFTFHAGTASAPEGTEIAVVTCSDAGFCDPAREAPAKQIDFEGVGTFKNVQSGPLKGVVVPDKNKVQRTFHWLRVHVEDIGEPGPGGKQPHSPDCTHIIGDEIVPDDCVNCPDVYQIEIHESADPTSPVIYSVGGFIDNGNLQIHPAIK